MKIFSWILGLFVGFLYQFIVLLLYPVFLIIATCKKKVFYIHYGFKDKE